MGAHFRRLRGQILVILAVGVVGVGAIVYPATQGGGGAVHVRLDDQQPGSTIRRITVTAVNTVVRVHVSADRQGVYASGTCARVHLDDASRPRST